MSIQGRRSVTQYPRNMVGNVKDHMSQLILDDGIVYPQDQVILVDSQLIRHPVKEVVAEFIFRGYLRFHWKEVLDVEKSLDGDVKLTKAFAKWDPFLNVNKQYMYFLDVRSNIMEKIISYAAEYSKIINSSEDGVRRNLWKNQLLEGLDPLSAYELALAAHYYDIIELKDLAVQKVIAGEWKGEWKGRFNSEALGNDIRLLEAHRYQDKPLLEEKFPAPPSYLARHSVTKEVLNSEPERARILEAILRSKKQGLPYVLFKKQSIPYVLQYESFWEFTQALSMNVAGKTLAQRSLIDPDDDKILYVIDPDHTRDAESI